MFDLVHHKLDINCTVIAALVRGPGQPKHPPAPVVLRGTGTLPPSIEELPHQDAVDIPSATNGDVAMHHTPESMLAPPTTAHPHAQNEKPHTHEMPS
jgi:hypothetical protein